MADLFNKKLLAARIVNTLDFTVNDSTDYSTNNISWDSTSYDTLDAWSNSNASRLTAKIPGFYRVEFHLHFTASAAGDYGVVVNKNGWSNGGVTTTDMGWGEQQLYSAGAAPAAISVLAYTYNNAGDFWEAFALQKTGAGRTADHTKSYFSMTLIGG